MDAAIVDQFLQRAPGDLSPDRIKTGDGYRFRCIIHNYIHTGSLFWRMFSSRGPVIPKLTWVPAHTVRGRRQHTQVGLSHPTGANAIGRLGRAGVEIPSGWVTVPADMDLPDNQQDRDMIARELLIKFQMSDKHPMVELMEAYRKF